MALTDTFVKNVKHSGSAAGDKITDGQGMHLLVSAAVETTRRPSHQVMLLLAV